MTVKKCDRCGNAARYSISADFSFKPRDNTGNPFVFPYKCSDVDLCVDCARGFLSWYHLIVDADKK